MSYIYLPFYGVEPYESNDVAVEDAFGGGAQLTNRNLLVSLFTVDTTDAGLPATGRLVKPAPNTEYNAEVDQLGLDVGYTGYANVLARDFDSRVSARFALQSDGIGEDDLPASMLAVLNPPPDLRQAMMASIRSVVRNAETSSGVEVVFDGPLNFNYLWQFSAVSLARIPGADAGATFGDIAFAALPLLRTGGEDGNFPQFFDWTDPGEGLYAMYTAVMRGEFYIPMGFTRADAEELSNYIYSVSWPHSVARR